MRPMISTLSWLARVTAPAMVALSAGGSPPAVRMPMRFIPGRPSLRLALHGPPGRPGRFKGEERVVNPRGDLVHPVLQIIEILMQTGIDDFINSALICPSPACAELAINSVTTQ